MKQFVFIAAVIFCLSVSSGFAQSNRSSTPDNNQKANKRPPNPVAPTAQTESSETNDDTALPIDDEIITVETEVVTIPVKVSNRGGRFVAGLTKENFTILEDGIEQPIEFFSNEQQPFTVALVLDMSYSSKFKINEIQSAAIAFIDQLRENDKVMVISFDEEVHVLTEPTGDRGQIYRAIKSTKVASGTSLYEAVDLVINKKLRRVKGRKAIVLFTDGVDTTSRRAHDLSNLRDALELDALIYPIKYDTYADVQAMKNKPVIVPPTQPSPIPSKNPSPFPFPIPTGGVGSPGNQGTSAEDYRKAGEYLNEMANRTGGQIYEANSYGSLANAFSKIASELREFYSLGYYPNNEAKAGGRRKIKVKVDQKGVSVRAREDYTIGKKKTN